MDLARGYAPLTFDRDANPDALPPTLLVDADGEFLRLAVKAGAYTAATHGQPDRCDRCELREPDKLPMATSSWHGFALRLASDFPHTNLRFVAAQLKANNGDSPLIALRVADGRLFADFRLCGATIELFDAFGASRRWTDIVLGIVAGRIELWIDGRLVASARAAFDAIAPSRFLKIGPYRDKHPGWGDAPAAIDVRHIRRGDCRDDVLPGPAGV